MVTCTSVDNQKLYTIENHELKIELFSFGARIIKLFYRGKDLLCGYDTPQEYLTDGLFIGATVGRFAGRIAGGRFSLGGREILLHQNENGINSHHGGYFGFDKQAWQGEILSDFAVRFSRISPDGECGYPGMLSVSVTYTLNDSSLEISFQAESDKDTLLNLTNHAYFNLDGFDGEDCRNMHLRVPADSYLPVNELLIPTGEIAPVKGTKFDFTAERKIATELDHYFVYRGEDGMRDGGTLYSPKSKLGFNLMTDMPGVQIYTCNAFEAENGKGGAPLHFHHGIALETQRYPDSPSHKHFSNTILKAGECFESKTVFEFFHR